MQRNCRGTSKCLQSCWGLEKLVFSGVLKVSCRGVASRALRNLATSVSMILDLLSLRWYVVGVACGMHRENGDKCVNDLDLL